MPVHFPSLAHRVNYRNHRKLTYFTVTWDNCGIIRLRYVRGINGGDWRDMNMRLVGGGVYGMQLDFLTDWFMATRQMITDPNYYPIDGNNGENGLVRPLTGGALVQIVISAPFGVWPNIMLGYNKVLLSARKYVYLQTPYFMPTQSLMEALQTAAMSGVRVQIMTAKKPGGFWLTWANESYFDEMLRAGVEIYLYHKGMLHSKTLVADDRVCSIGSANLDFRSMLDTYEDTAFVYDQELSCQVRELFEEARRDCIKLDFRQWQKRNLRRRLLESFVRLFTPLF